MVVRRNRPYVVRRSRFFAPGGGMPQMKEASPMGPVDTAEIRTRDPVEKAAALGARDELRSLVLGKMLRVRTTDTMDKYGRLLADVWLLDSGDDEPSVNQKLIDRWGVPYAGGHKERTTWSDFPRSGTQPL